ncbi:MULTISPECIES: septum formation initiator family protein [unclassified Clostridium]|uniref:FtsB family cell division protein n=1 Tax=unclassified Clostridium TaxID=2614128 RepID=UPI000297FC6D|nr:MULTISPECIES: septum formation initiator family protein [unclassified Clostridium]EKQ55972.1 MAG: septum formation initiator [Clostridium sp. Maddingley MBC34-26]
MKKKLIIKRIIIAGFIIFFTFSYIRQSITMNRIQKEIDNKQSQLNEIKQKNERLQDEVDKINSDSSDYLEKLARERLGMIKPGEKVVNSEVTGHGSN